MDFSFLYKDYGKGGGRDPVPKIGEEITRYADDGQIKMVTLYKRNHSARSHKNLSIRKGKRAGRIYSI